jgi:subtilase family serine protease
MRLERRTVPAIAFPGINGITFDSSGDVFVSYNSTDSSGQQQSVAEVGSNGFLANSSVFSTSGTGASPGALTSVGTSSSLPNLSSSSDILELLPNGQLFVFDPAGTTSSQYDNLANLTAGASKVFDVQSGASVDLSTKISLANATFGDFGIYKNSFVVSAESNSWDFVMRVTYGSSGGVATVLAAAPASDGLSAAPEGVAVDSVGNVLTTLPYVPAGSNTAMHVPVGFGLFFDTGTGAAPTIPTLGLTGVPDIDSGGITVDSQNNFILAVSRSSLYGGGPGIVHINGALTAFLADPASSSAAVPSGIAYQHVGGTNYLAFTNPAQRTYTLGTELPLFDGQASPAQLRQAYGVNQINFAGPKGTTVKGDGAGQTIAIVEEGVDPTLGTDLTTFDNFFGIPAPPSFKVVDQNDVTTQNLDIVGEASLDVEWAHAIAPGASIVVYNAAYVPTNPDTSFINLMDAMQEASKLPGVSVVTLSYGETEQGVAVSGLDQQAFDATFTTPGVTFLAASGDSGVFGDGGSQVAANFPAASPNIVSVGGTSIVIDAAGDYPGTGTSGEVAWGTGRSSGSTGGGGGGLSAGEPEPSWQAAVVPTSIDPNNKRALPDVSMDSGAAQEYDVFTSTLGASSDSASAVGWLGDAGTSAASPIWAGLIAIADQGRALAGGTPLTGYTQTLPALYSLPNADFHDIVTGSNGDPALPGYDLATGLGTPVANLLVPDLARYQLATAPPANATKVSVTTAPSAPVFGQSVTLTATVSVTGSGSGVPTGTVTFLEGSTVLGTAKLSGGVAKFSIIPASAGTEHITVSYGGDTNDQQDSLDYSLSVAKATPTITWPKPANITVGTPLGSAQLDATASVAGSFDYMPPSGAFLGVGQNQTLSAIFTPSDTTDYQTVSATTTINVLPAALHVVSITPASNTYAALPGGQIVVTFNQPLANLTPDVASGGGFTANPFAVDLVPRGPTGTFAAPSGFDDGSVPIHATLIYHVNADGTSTITLLPRVPLGTDVYLITVSGKLTSQAGAPLTNASGQGGPEYETFTIRATPPSAAHLKVASVTTLHATVNITNGAIIPQPDTIAIAFNKPVDFLTTNTGTVQLFAAGSSTPQPAAVAYSPTTMTVYLTPEGKLVPGTRYTIRVAASITDDQAFPNPDAPYSLGAPFTTSFQVRSAGVGPGTGPFVALSTNGHLNASPHYGTRSTPFGYASIPFSQTVNLAALGRYSVMLTPQSGGLNNNAFDTADTPLNAQIAFNPNDNALIIIPTVLLTYDTYLYSLNNIQSTAGNKLTNPGGKLPVYDTFQLSVTATIAAATRSAMSALDVRTESPSAPVVGAITTNGAGQEATPARIGTAPMTPAAPAPPRATVVRQGIRTTHAAWFAALEALINEA